MFSLSIKSRIVGLVVTIGVVLSVLLAVFGPYQAKKLGTEVMQNDTRFIARLLAENLALGMQTVFLDEGEALDQTLQLLAKDSDGGDAAISDVWVYDDQLIFVAGLNESQGHKAERQTVGELVLDDLEESVVAWSPMRSPDGSVLGYVEIHFSKKMLLDAVSSNATFALTTSAVTILITCVLAFLLGNSVGRPISEISKVAESVSSGDISHSIEIRSKDEIGLLADSFRKLIDYMKGLATAAERIADNDLTVKVEPKSGRDVLGRSFQTMVTNLIDVVRQLSTTSNQVLASADEISATAEQTSAGVRNQNSQIDQVSSAMEEMSATIIQSARNAEDATGVSKGASEMATSGGQIVNETIHGMQKIASVVRDSADSIGKLAESADQIGDIIGVINDIADQTNLLALNAAIEAARAGEQGRGFAVVADEVRKLAERTGKATGEITEMIGGIQTDTRDAVSSMQTGIEEVDSGRELADRAGSSLTEIVSMNQRVMDMVQQIATAAAEQSTAGEEISKNVDQVSTIARDTASGAEKSAAAAAELNRQSEKLQTIVTQFLIDQ